MGSLSDFLKKFRQYFLDKDWEDFIEPKYLPLNRGDSNKDQLVEFCLTKKEIVLKISTDFADNSYANAAAERLCLLITVFRKKYSYETQTYEIVLCGPSTVQLYINKAYYNTDVFAYTGSYSYQCYLHYKEDKSILFFQFFPDTYYRDMTTSSEGLIVYQPVIKTFNSQYINNYMQAHAPQFGNSVGEYYYSIKLDQDYTELAYRIPIKQAYNILENQLLLSKNIEIYDSTRKSFWGIPLGIIGAQGVTRYRFYNINNKKYFCFQYNLLICCEDEDDLTPTLPEGVEVIDMAPKPSTTFE